MGGYAIICEARAGESLGISTLGLVDRRKTRSFWWTSDSPHLLMEFPSRDAAEIVRKRMRFNRPAIVSISEAVRLLSEQDREITYNEAMSDQSWDAHKDCF